MRIPCLHPGKRRSGYFVFLMFRLEHWQLAAVFPAEQAVVRDDCVVSLQQFPTYLACLRGLE